MKTLLGSIQLRVFLECSAQLNASTPGHRRPAFKLLSENMFKHDIKLTQGRETVQAENRNLFNICVGTKAGPQRQSKFMVHYLRR